MDQQYATVSGILKQQIGVPTFMELGAHEVQNYTDGIRFKIKTNRRRIRRVAVVLTPNDLYTVKHSDNKGFDYHEVADIYNDQLREVLLGLLKV